MNINTIYYAFTLIIFLIMFYLFNTKKSLFSSKKSAIEKHIPSRDLMQ